MNINKLIEICEFRELPFDINPHNAPHIWVGHSSVVETLIELIGNVIDSNLREFLIVSGVHGSGKSQCLQHLKWLVEQKYKNECIVIYIDNVTALGGKRTFVDCYKYILGTVLNKAAIIQIFKKANDFINRMAVNEIKKQPNSDTILSDDAEAKKWRERSYEKVVGSGISQISYDQFIEVTNGKEEAIENISDADSSVLAAKSLGTIIKLATIRDSNKNAIGYRAIFICADQMEDVGTLPGGVYQEQIKGWRTLFDEATNGFGLVFGLDGSAEDIEPILSDAISRRKTLPPIALATLQPNECRDFIVEIIKAFRNPSSGLPGTYPFNEDGLTEIVNRTVEKLPSQLLNNCRRVFSKVALNEDIKTTSDWIDREIVAKYL